MIPTISTLDVELPETAGPLAALRNSTGTIRRQTITRITPGDRWLELELAEHDRPVKIGARRPLRLGDWTITATEYAHRALDPGDLIDLAVDTGKIIALWVSIDRIGGPVPSRSFSLKDDHLFALRARSGEKAERRVRDHLVAAGHAIRLSPDAEPGPFVLRSAGKGHRSADLACTRCGMTVEVKKRNHDRRLRVSHSTARPFTDEHKPADGYHAFVWPDFTIELVANATIIDLIARRQTTAGHDRHDRWTDLPADTPTLERPPACYCQAEAVSAWSDRGEKKGDQAMATPHRLEIPTPPSPRRLPSRVDDLDDANRRLDPRPSRRVRGWDSGRHGRSASAAGAGLRFLGALPTAAVVLEAVTVATIVGGRGRRSPSGGGCPSASTRDLGRLGPVMVPHPSAGTLPTVARTGAAVR